MEDVAQGPGWLGWGWGGGELGVRLLGWWQGVARVDPEGLAP